MPRVSAIIPTYNRIHFLKTAVNSVLAQTFTNWELLIIDDGSTDNTAEFIRSLNHPEIKYFYQSNKGPAAARNTGIKNASARLIAFLDTDDQWLPEKLALQVKAMEENPSFLISHTEETWYRGSRMIKPLDIHKKRNHDIFWQSLKLCAMSPSTVMLRKELFAEAGLFDEKLEVCEDYDLWLRITARYPVLLLDQPLTVKQGGHYDQQSRKYPGLDKFRIYSIRNLLQSGILSEEQQALAQKELAHKCLIYAKGCDKYNKPEEAAYYYQLHDKYQTAQ